jgi:hypothetical protein
MGRLAFLTILALLISADGAAARTSTGIHHRSSGHVRMPKIHTPRLGGSRHRGHRLKTISVPVGRGPALGARRTFVASDDIAPGDHPGWFKQDKEAGLGFSQGGARTMVGLYQRPTPPDIPGPQTLHDPEGRGAAGLSLSFKLGQ